MDSIALNGFVLPVDSANTFHALRAALARAHGPEQALTLDELAAIAGTSRREVESIMETRFLDFGFPLVSGSSGYWIPAEADEINHYIRALRSRAFKIFLRAQRAARAARTAGWPQQGRTFFNPPARQGELNLQTETERNA